MRSGPSRYWDRLQRPGVTSAMEAMRVLTNVSDTGAVTCLPKMSDRGLGLPGALRATGGIRHSSRFEARSQSFIRAAHRPLIVAEGRDLFGHRSARAFAGQTGIPVAETQAGKGSLRYDHPQSLGAMGVTGTPGANITAREADLVIGIGTRYSDFARFETAFQGGRALRPQRG
jgi:3D-(3,5/4)-trihydroxycyclohexane-1,2-dione acylhydrolase (decyclizing)